MTDERIGIYYDVKPKKGSIENEEFILFR